jgi:hypothetical protein
MLRKGVCQAVMVLLLIGLFACPLSVSGASDAPAGIVHDVYGTEDYLYARILGYTGSEEDLTLPAVIDGYPVRYVALNQNGGGKCPRRLVIPEGVRALGQMRWQDSTALEEIVLPNSLQAIGNLSLADCTSLRELTVPASVTLLAANALPQTLALRGEKGSYIARWAVARQRPFEAIPPSNTLGDVDEDGLCASGDARLILQSATRKVTLTAAQTQAADVDRSGAVDSADARIVLQYAVGKPVSADIGALSETAAAFLSMQEVQSVKINIHAYASGSSSGVLTDPTALIDSINQKVLYTYTTTEGTWMTRYPPHMFVVYTKDAEITVSDNRELHFFGLSFKFAWDDSLTKLAEEALA